MTVSFPCRSQYELNDSSHSIQRFRSQFLALHNREDPCQYVPLFAFSSFSNPEYQTLRKLLANAHRVFVTEDNGVGGSPTTTSPPPLGNLLLRGVVSIVDGPYILHFVSSYYFRTITQLRCDVLVLVLSLFARLANIPDVDPTRMQRHRRMSSASASSSKSGR